MTDNIDYKNEVKDQYPNADTYPVGERWRVWARGSGVTFPLRESSREAWKAAWELMPLREVK